MIVRARQPLDIGVRRHPEDVGVDVRGIGQHHRFRSRHDEHDLVLLGDRRHRRRLGRGQGAGQEIDIVLDDHFAGDAHCLVGAGLAVARQDFQFAAEHATLGVDLGDRHLGAFEDRLAIDRGRSGERDRKADLDRLRRDGGKRHARGGGEQHRQPMT